MSELVATAPRILPTRPLPPAKLILMMLLMLVLLAGVSLLIAVATVHGAPVHTDAMTYHPPTS